ncbi:MAG: FHA domain-containing protein [Planctomycetota bacterium]|nr:FHA domain-containing protein [Planctomycetota bacterium]
MQRIPTLVGIAGHFAGEVYPLRYGKTLTVGRSRDADFSLKRTEKYRTQTPEERERDESAQTVSAKHFQITMYNLRSIEVKNLSPNGLQVDGKPVEQAVLNDVANKPHELRFGLEEALRLEMRMHEDQE